MEKRYTIDPFEFTRFFDREENRKIGIGEVAYRLNSLTAEVERLRARSDRFETERDKLKHQLTAARERIKAFEEAVSNAFTRLNAWKNHCDYRAESDIQKACKILHAALSHTEESRRIADLGIIEIADGMDDTEEAET